MPTGPMKQEIQVTCRRCHEVTPAKTAVFVHLRGLHCPKCASEVEADETTR